MDKTQRTLFICKLGKILENCCLLTAWANPKDKEGHGHELVGDFFSLVSPVNFSKIYRCKKVSVEASSIYSTYVKFGRD